MTPITCMYCMKDSDAIAIDNASDMTVSFEVARLRRIPPLSEPESVDHEQGELA